MLVQDAKRLAYFCVSRTSYVACPCVKLHRLRPLSKSGISLVNVSFWHIATSSTASQYVRNPRTSGLPLNATSTQMDPQPTWADHYRVFYFALGP